MAYKISDDCISCGVCEKACRRKAITMEDGKIIINDDLCNYCGRCVTACPTNAMEGTSGYLVYFGGTFGNDIQKGTDLVPILRDEETLYRVTDAAIDYLQKTPSPESALPRLWSAWAGTN